MYCKKVSWAIHDNWEWDRPLLGYLGLLWKEGILTNVGALKGMDYGPKQLWEFEDEFVVGGLGVHYFSLLNFLGFNLWG